MTLFEEPVNNLEFRILCAGIWEIDVDHRPTYFKKHSAADAWRYRYTPAISEEVWCPEIPVETDLPFFESSHLRTT